MGRVVILLTLLAGLAACAGGSIYSSQRAVRQTQTTAPQYISVTPGAKPVTSDAGVAPAAPVVLFSTGPIYTACLNAGRKAASRQRCGCAQWVADQELSPAQQKRGAGYFTNQAELQRVRQSNSPANEAFWTAWKAYGQNTANMCRGA